MTIKTHFTHKNLTKERGNIMWQHKTETFDSTFDTKKSIKRKMDQILERCGKDGWELVSFQCAGAFGSVTILVFKKPVE